ncbi:MAG: DUF1573 domain-containing protein [Bacteroidetes bacterium]|nr:DUF1573 domain-containing protein [Bacteroidota bacterium]
MKKSILFPLSAITMSCAILFAGTAFVKPKQTGVVWNETTHNFGDIKIGPAAVAKFTFKNKNKEAMTIQSVEPGCSCTVSSFTSEPVRKNKSGSVIATYKTEGRPGFFKKFIKVTFTSGATAELIITGNVVQEPKL